MTTHLIYVDGTAYESIPQLASLLGKPWLSIDLSSMGASSTPTSIEGSLGNPTQMLKLLAAQGNAVTSLGGSTVGGVAVQGYSVTFSPAYIKAQLANPNLPSWMRQIMTQVQVGGITYKVYIDGSGLLRRVSTTTSESVASVVSVSVDETLDFSDYGTAVSIAAPPAATVETYHQALSQLGPSAAGAGSTA